MKTCAALQVAQIIQLQSQLVTPDNFVPSGLVSPSHEDVEVKEESQDEGDHDVEVKEECHDEDMMEDNSREEATGENVHLPCRSIRVGSYKSMPKERAVFTEKGIHLKVPDICSDGKIITLNFRLGEILRVDAHFGRQMPILFINLTPSSCARARQALGMRDPSTGLWLDSTSKDETRKRITILPEKLSDDAKMILKRLFDPNLTEVDAKAANTMLVASSPKDSATARAAFIRDQQQHLSVTAVTATRKPVQRDKQVNAKYCQFPPSDLNIYFLSDLDTIVYVFKQTCRKMLSPVHQRRKVCMKMRCTMMQSRQIYLTRKLRSGMQIELKIFNIRSNRWRNLGKRMR